MPCVAKDDTPQTIDLTVTSAVAKRRQQINRSPHQKRVLCDKDRLQHRVP